MQNTNREDTQQLKKIQMLFIILNVILVQINAQQNFTFQFLYQNTLSRNQKQISSKEYIYHFIRQSEQCIQAIYGKQHYI
ncbi:hypothetical protein pb186bvf_000693 [Paramecium bursaria]